MAFVDSKRILVLEKNIGLVRLISDGVLQQQPALKLPIDIKWERGSRYCITTITSLLSSFAFLWNPITVLMAQTMSSSETESTNTNGMGI
ncbi:MAG: hypothetical protein M3P08_20210 [Thermoproteota archaeon]|nr:hypothetical protein [Thermoproteota archaeon]